MVIEIFSLSLMLCSSESADPMNRENLCDFVKHGLAPPPLRLDLSAYRMRQLVDSGPKPTPMRPEPGSCTNTVPSPETGTTSSGRPR